MEFLFEKYSIEKVELCKIWNTNDGSVEINDTLIGEVIGYKKEETDFEN